MNALLLFFWITVSAESFQRPALRLPLLTTQTLISGLLVELRFPLWPMSEEPWLRERFGATLGYNQSVLLTKNQKII